MSGFLEWCPGFTTLFVLLFYKKLLKNVLKTLKISEFYKKIDKKKLKNWSNFMKKNLKKPVKPVNYITIPGKILQDTRLSSTDKLVYGLCVSFINSTQNFKAGTHYISSVLGISRRVVFDSLSKLDRLNLLDITVVRSDGKNPVREISLPKTSFDQRGQLQFDDLIGLFNRVVKK